MGKKYYIKKTSLEKKEYYAIKRSDSGFMEYASNPTPGSKLIVDEDDFNTKVFNVRLYGVEKVEFEEIIERYNIANFHPNQNAYTYMKINYTFQERIETYSTYDLQDIKKILEKMHKNYQYPNDIRIIVEYNNKKYDYETGIRFNDINLYLKLEEMKKELLNLTEKEPVIYRPLSKEIDIHINYLKQRGIGGVDDRDI